MKKIINILLCFCVCIFITGCEDEKASLNVLNWSSYIPDEVVRDFEKETGIKVNYGTYSSNEELLAKISSAKEGTYDLIFPSDYMIELMINRNMLERLEKSNLENINNINEKYLNLEFDKNNDYSLPFLAASTVIAYNTNKIEDNITSYNDLLNSKYKENIVLIDDQRIIIGMALQALGYDMNDTDINHLSQAKTWLLKLKKNVKAFDSDSPKTFLINGEVDIAVLWNAEAAIAMRENGAIKAIFPTDGFAISIDNYAIPVGAKNTENAYKFIDYLLREDVMKKIIEDYPYKNINKKTDEILSYDYLSNNAANIDDETYIRGSFVKNIGESIRNYDKLWAEIK